MGLNRKKLALILATLVTLGIISMLWYDVTIVQKLAAWEQLQSGDIKRTIALCEGYGVLPMIALLLLGLAILIPDTRRRMLQTITAVLLAGIAAQVIKHLIARERPRSFLSQHIADIASSTWHSFPSGHTATAAALTAMLWAMFPQITARIYFAVLLALLGFQRVISQAHYPSDVLFGAVLGITVAATVQHMFWRVRDCDKVIGTPPIPNPRDLTE